MTLIGSKALRYHFPDFPRNPHDEDVVNGSQWEWGAGPLRVERHDNPVLREYLGTAPMVAHPDELYTLKVSHIFWDIKWDKHMFDIVWLRRKGCTLVRGLFDALYDHWSKVHGAVARQNLNMSKDAFFDNALQNQDRHDDLHRIINPNPVYVKILVGEILTSKVLFNKLPDEEKRDLIREETMVMAYERLAGRDYRTAYLRQLKDMVTRHLPHEQALYAVENFEALHKPPFNYKERIDNELQRDQR